MIALCIVFYFAHYFSLIKLNEACTLMVIVREDRCSSLIKRLPNVQNCCKAGTVTIYSFWVRMLIFLVQICWF